MIEDIKKEIRPILCHYISEMLDNPDEYGLFHTSDCFNAIERDLFKILDKYKDKIVDIDTTKQLLSHEHRLYKKYSDMWEELKENHYGFPFPQNFDHYSYNEEEHRLDIQESIKMIEDKYEVK